MKSFYVTTPIYYINAKPHIGHAYTTLAADILNRHHKRKGERSHFLTGTDEHGFKIEEAARAEGLSPQDYSDRASRLFQDLWKRLDVRHDDFIRTTEPRHEARVRAAVEALRASGDIYKGKYGGFYCVSCETYWTQTDAGTDLRCLNADCRKPLSRVEEESWFFALSKYQERLLGHYRAHPEFLQPGHRANEILRFVESGLQDLSVSRDKSQVSWGVEFPFDQDRTVYVWFDALLNYVSAAGWGEPRFEELWPADVHLVGKEIYRFHAVIWPAMLMALGLPLPRAVFAHGWWTIEGEKMSKSKGNFVDPGEITREFGVDALRYFLFREMPFGNDGDFSRDALRRRYNAELANDLGNLVSRVLQMVDKYLHGELPPKPPADRPSLSKEVAAETPAIDAAMDSLAFQGALNRMWAVIGRLNKTVDQEAPWKLAKTDPERLKHLLFDWIWSLRIIAGWLDPFMPHTSAKMQSLLGVRRVDPRFTVSDLLGGAAGESNIHKGPPLFPRK